MTSPTLSIWPRLGTTVTLASGYVVTAAGSTALLTDEIANLLARGKLLTYDPTGVNPDPSPLPPSGGGGSEWTRLINVRSYGATGNGLSNDTAAIKTAAAALVNGGRLFFPSGVYLIDDTIELPLGGANNVTVYGENATGFFYSGTQLRWTGTSGKPMFRVFNTGSTFEFLRFTSAGAGVGPLAYVAYGKEGIAGCTQQTIRYTSFEGLDANQVGCCVGLGVEGSGVPGNLENFKFEHVGFNDSGVGLWIRSGQPYNTALNACTFGSSVTLKNTGIRIDASMGFTLQADNTDFQGLERGIYCLVQGSYISVRGGSCEHTKRFLEQFINDNNSPGTIKMENLRINADNINLASPNILASDGDIIKVSGATHVTMVNCGMTTGLVAPTAMQMNLGGNTRFSAIGCNFHRNTPGLVYRGPFIGLLQATEFWGCSYFDDLASPKIQPIMNRHGAETPVGTVTISAGNTFADVTGLATEPDANYQVICTVQSTTGTPAAGSLRPYVTGKAAVPGIGGASFRVNLEAAPGGGNSVTVAWMMVR